MRKILLVFTLVVTLITSSICCVGAAGSATLDQLWVLLDGRQVSVPVDIQVNDIYGNFGDTAVVSGSSNIIFRAILDMTDVRNVVGRVENELTAEAFTSLKAMPVSGSFEITVSMGDISTIPASITTGNMSGFTFYDENGDLVNCTLFEEGPVRILNGSQVTSTISIVDETTVEDILDLPAKIMLEQAGFKTTVSATVGGTLVPSTTIGRSINAHHINYTVPTIAPATVTLSSGGGMAGGGGGGGGSSSGSDVVKNDDGSVTTTKTDKATGTVTVTTVWPDGKEEVVETKKDGTVTTTNKDASGNTVEKVEKPNGDVKTTETNTDGTEKSVEELADGTVITTEKDTEGNTVTVTQSPDETVTTTTTDKDGNTVTRTENADGDVKTTETKKDGTTVTTTTPENGDTTAEIVVSGDKETVVEIPVENINSIVDITVTDKSGNKVDAEYTIDTEAGVVIVKVKGSSKVAIDINKNIFSDVHDVDHWATEYVDFVFAKGLMNGTGAKTFDPELPITRGMFITVVHRLEGAPIVEKNSTFLDVYENKYYTEAVEWGYQNGIILGYSDEEYAPEEPIYREQMAAIIHRYVTYKNTLDIKYADGTVEYTDIDKVTEYAKNAVLWNTKNGFLKGYEDETFRATNLATRAEVATIFTRFFKAIYSY